MRKLVVLPNDPLHRYYEKGEIKARYFNPCDYFDEIHVISLSEEDISPDKVSIVAGKARLYIHTVGRPSLFSMLSLRKKVFSLVQTIAPQCIRAYNPLLMGWYAVYCGEGLGIPSVVSVHDDYSIWRRRKTYGKGYWARAAYQLAYRLSFEKYTFRHADRIICAYQFVKRYAEAFRRDGIEVIYNRVDLRRFSPDIVRESKDDPSVSSQSAPLKVICVGRQFKGKDPRNIVRAIKNLPVKLTLIGKGPLHQPLRLLAEELQVEQQVEFIEGVPNEQLAKYYAAHDVFAMMIIQPGVCIPVLEAMASGLPIVISRPVWEETPEVVGDLAIQVEDTADGYRQAFQALLANPDLRKTLGKQVRERVFQFDGKIMEEKEKRLYESLCATEDSNS